MTSQIERTLVNGSVPVYTDFLGGRTKVITLIRRCGGDIEVESQLLSSLFLTLSSLFRF
jgi:hypothetical protein